MMSQGLYLTGRGTQEWVHFTVSMKLPILGFWGGCQMVYMLLLKQLLVPPRTTFAEWRVESLSQGKQDMWPWNQEGAGSNGNLSSHQESKADVNQPTSAQEPLHGKVLCGSALKSSLDRSQILYDRAPPFRLAILQLWDCFYPVILTWEVLPYRAMTGAHGQSCSWVRAIWFFHWLFSVQLKNSFVKKISTVSKH